MDKPIDEMTVDEINRAVRKIFFGVQGTSSFGERGTTTHYDIYDNDGNRVGWGGWSKEQAWEHAESDLPDYCGDTAAAFALLEMTPFFKLYKSVYANGEKY